MTTHLPLATQAMAGHIGFAENVQYQVVGIAIVLCALGALAVVVSILGHLLAPRKPQTVLAAPLPAAPPAAIPPDVRAAIAAAVYASVRTPHRILEVRQPPDPRLSAWSVEGRRQIFHSHTVR